MRVTRRGFLGRSLALAAVPASRASAVSSVPLAGTAPLTMEGDLAAQMVDGIHRDLDRRLAEAIERGPRPAPADSDPRRRLRTIIGVVDERLPPQLELVTVEGTIPNPAGRGAGFSIAVARWQVLPGVFGEGLLLVPKGKSVARVVALPDADWSPEALVGLAPGVPAAGQFARRLAENGCLVLVPVLIDRSSTWSGNPRLGKMTNQPHREYVYRMAYEVGRHVIGYEVQKILGAVDWFEKPHEPRLPIGVAGYGEGGILALYSAAVDPRIDAIMVSGTFGYSAVQEAARVRSLHWEEPIYRNVWRRLPDFTDGGLGAMVGPRGLVVEVSAPPAIDGPPPPRQGQRGGAAPGRSPATWGGYVDEELRRTRDAYRGLEAEQRVHKVENRDGPPGSERALTAFLGELGVSVRLKPPGRPPTDARRDFDASARLKRQFDELVLFSQEALRRTEVRRQDFFWARASKDSPDAWRKSCEPLRRAFHEDALGALEAARGPANARSRLAHDTRRWRGYEVVLDVHPEVYAYGILLVPKDLKPGERRPVVVCQHGLEGRPQNVVDPTTKTRYYNSFGAALADRGYIVFAPQNPYIGGDRFRTLQRKANLLGLSIYSFIVRQHERILDWMATLPFVDQRRMAFYGLSYGGKTAMRVPALLDRYCLSIASGDFNDWISKMASTDNGVSYMFTGEYELYDFDLGNTFNYAEMAGLIAPRPFMVERGHDDGVGIDEWVAYEYAKVRRLYDQLGIGDRTAIEYFNGGHEIHGRGTFEFLDKHLGWRG